MVVPFWVFNFINISSWNVLKISNRLSHIHCACESVVLIKDGVIDWNVASVFVVLWGGELLFCKWLHAWMSVTCWNCSMEIWLSRLSLSWFSCWLSWSSWFYWLRLNRLSWLNRFWRLNNRLCWLSRLSWLNRFGWCRSGDGYWLFLCRLSWLSIVYRCCWSWLRNNRLRYWLNNMMIFNSIRCSMRKGIWSFVSVKLSWFHLVDIHLSTCVVWSSC